MEDEQISNASAGSYAVTFSDSRKCYTAGGNLISYTKTATLDAAPVLPSVFFNKAINTTCEISVQSNGDLTQKGTVTWLRLNTKGIDGKPLVAGSDALNPYHPTAHFEVAGGGVTLEGAPEGIYIEEYSTGNGCKTRTLDYPGTGSSPFGFIEQKINKRANKFILHYAYKFPEDNYSVPELPEAEEQLIEDNNEAIEQLFNGVAHCKTLQTGYKQQLDWLCLNEENYDDKVTIAYDAYYAHHTLYYYDRKGQLVKTVPPEGVNYLSGEKVQKIITTPMQSLGVTATLRL